MQHVKMVNINVTKYRIGFGCRVPQLGPLLDDTNLIQVREAHSITTRQIYKYFCKMTGDGKCDIAIVFRTVRGRICNVKEEDTEPVWRLFDCTGTPSPKMLSNTV